MVTNKHRLGKPSGTRNTGRNWHTDLSYSLRPAKGALLLCQEKPPVGGDTMWANLTMAYETLSPTMQRFIEGLEAVHDVSLVKGIGQRDPAVIQGCARATRRWSTRWCGSIPTPAASRCWPVSASPHPRPDRG
ncbi:TauD/TfdA dioxygenase family protein [Siccirubricoccus deserti]